MQIKQKIITLLVNIMYNARGDSKLNQFREKKL